MPIFPVFHHNIGKNTSKSFLKKSIDRKKFSSSNVVSYAKIIQKNAWASLLQFAGVTLPHLPRRALSRADVSCPAYLHENGTLYLARRR